jgi:hypothetical protein
VELPYWEGWIGNCANCGKLLKNGAGILCANFSSSRGRFQPCQEAWCGGCYTVPIGSPYPIRKPVDDDGFEATAQGGESHFKIARDGDNLLPPFFSTTSATSEVSSSLIPRLEMEATVMAYETSNTCVTQCPMYGYWFERFILGCQPHAHGRHRQFRLCSIQGNLLGVD